jgi:hypothetical protein
LQLTINKENEALEMETQRSGIVLFLRNLMSSAVNNKNEEDYKKLKLKLNKLHYNYNFVH